MEVTWSSLAAQTQAGHIHTTYGEWSQALNLKCQYTIALGQDQTREDAKNLAEQRKEGWDPALTLFNLVV